MSQVGWEATKGGTDSTWHYEGDIAIDSISIESGMCPQHGKHLDVIVVEVNSM